MLRGKHIVIGVTGGIAAYKAVYLVREFQESGADVRVTVTDAATRFVGRETFAALTRHDVPVHIFPDNPAGISENWTRHIQWAEWADIMVIAPCTANSLAKIVHGFSDSMLTATILAARCPILICPTMDGEMYQAPATVSNIEKARSLGFHLLPPTHGYLASGLEGQGRLPEPKSIITEVERILDSKQTVSNLPLAGKTFLITCGATREFLDPVRFLSNPSTGKMGLAMAEAAHALGAKVILLHADAVDTSQLPASVHTTSFVSTDDLFLQVKKHSNADVVVMTAAVSDFKPANQHARKVKKADAELQIALERTPDILKWLGEQRSHGQVLIGFAMETENIAEHAKEKRERKGADWIIGNLLQKGESGFAVDTNTILVVGPEGEASFEGTKSHVARRALEHIFVS